MVSLVVMCRLFGSHELRFDAPRQDAQATVISQQGSVLFRRNGLLPLAWFLNPRWHLTFLTFRQHNHQEEQEEEGEVSLKRIWCYC